MRSFAPLVALATFLVATTFASTAPVTLQTMKVDDGIDLEMLNTAPVAGYQGTLTRIPDKARPTPVEGPLSQTGGFIFDFSNKTNIFLAFSLTGTSIPEQSTVLLIKQQDFGQLFKLNIETKGRYCIGELVFSDPFGQEMDFEFTTEDGGCVNFD